MSTQEIKKETKIRNKLTVDTTLGLDRPLVSISNEVAPDELWKALDDQPNEFPEATLKLEELFFKWISQEATIQYVQSLIDQPPSGAENARQIKSPVGSSSKVKVEECQPPLSPRRTPKSKSKGIKSPQNGKRLPSNEPRLREIPRFYKTKQDKGINSKLMDQEITMLFDRYPSHGIGINDFVAICKPICGFPSFFSAPLFRRILLLNLLWDKVEGEGKEIEEAALDVDLERAYITRECFERFKERELDPYDDISRFFRLVKQINRDYIEGSDFLPFLEELLSFHPGLEFLESTPKFQEKYARTVIARILYSVNTSWSGKITELELRKSDLFKACQTVDEEEDINLVYEYFSYEHFYVLYCKFWELDTDHDFHLSKEDLIRHGGHSLTSAIVDRIFSEAPRPFVSDVKGKMSYEDFIFFFLAEEDKTTYSSLKYWFSCVDLDGDGVIRPWEMKHFYDQQLSRMQSYSHEVIPFSDIVCQMHDCLVPKNEGAVVLEDFLHPHRVRISGAFFNVLFNLNKFIALEQRDPFTIRQQREQPDLSDW